MMNIVTVFLLGLAGFLPVQAFANEQTQESVQESAATGFTYESIKPDNQHSNAGYFDLRMKPGQVQTVQIKLKNPSSEEITINVALNGAKTNMNGVLEYGPTAIENDASLKYDFADIVKGPESVTIPPNSEKNLDLTITMPEVSYDGLIAGGIQLQQETKNEEQSSGTGIINKYAYVIAMLLTENDTKVTPELKLNRVYPELNNFRNTIFVNFSNITATYVNDMATEIQIMEKDNDKVLYETKKTGMRMAPNSLIDFPVSMEGDRMVAGDYRAKIVVTSGEQKWEWEENFTITDEDADKFNNQDVDLTNESGFNWVLIGSVIGAVLAAAIIIFVIIRVVVKKKEQKKQAEKQAKKKNSSKK